MIGKETESIQIRELMPQYYATVPFSVSQSSGWHFCA